MAIGKSKGTPEQFLNAVKNRISRLGGEDVESSTIIGETVYQDMDGCVLGLGETATESELRRIYEEMKGDPVVDQYDSFESWIDDTVGNGYMSIVESAAESDKYAEVTHETIEAADDDDPEGWLRTLIDRCDEELDQEVDSTVWDHDDDNIYLTVTYMNHVIELEIPFDDLTMSDDPDFIEGDMSYIVNSVLQDLDDQAWED